jgi:Polyketide cyclase / dehydrase and lipid transport
MMIRKDQFAHPNGRGHISPATPSLQSIRSLSFTYQLSLFTLSSTEPEQDKGVEAMRRLIRIVGLVAAFIIVLLLVVLVGGLLLPEEHRASRTLVTKQSPQAIWETINDHANEPKWRSDVASVTSLGERNGKPVLQENYKDGNTVALMTTESRPPTRMVREIAEEGPFSGRWEIDIQPTQSGSNVTITEVGKVPNPFFRFISKYVLGHTTQMERYLTNLAGKFGEQPQFVKLVSL